jgi:hypothetical protein
MFSATDCGLCAEQQGIPTGFSRVEIESCHERFALRIPTVLGKSIISIGNVLNSDMFSRKLNQLFLASCVHFMS